MKIARNAVVALDYTLTNDAGEVLDKNEAGDPLTYLHGRGQLVAGLEAALEGEAKGAHLQVVVSPKDGYGEKGTGRVLEVPREQFPEGGEPEVGMAIEAADAQGHPILLWIVGANDRGFLLSLEHPLAGQTLHFDVTVLDVRAATKDEIAHGHAHTDHDDEHA